MKKAALISVSDKANLVQFARKLSEAGYVLLTTSGSGKYLAENGVESTSIADYTGQQEILNGRVKTLHPKIHGGLLANRGISEHMQQLDEAGIIPIEIAVINLYPFVKNLAGEARSDADRMVELIDIGGPTMIRAAAKNYKFIYPVIDPADYDTVLEMIQSRDAIGSAALEFRRKLAVKVFAALAEYNLQIARYFSNVTYRGKDNQPVEKALVDESTNFNLGCYNGFLAERIQELRYGENPHQKGAFFKSLGKESGLAWQQLQGKELSYNNFLDFDAAIRMLSFFKDDGPFVAIFKHLNPCGAARADNQLEALLKAKQGDPRSHFGGIIALNEQVSGSAAENIVKDFAEIVVAPDFSAEALAQFSKKKNLRVVKVDLSTQDDFEWRSAAGGLLMQQIDSAVSDIASAKLAAGRELTPSESADLQLAWQICGLVKSNAIVLVKDQMLIGTGAGQMSRIDSVELALSKAKNFNHATVGAVAASDAFFPFSDGVETLAKNGVTAVVQPGGSLRDEEVIAKAEELGVSMLLTGERHFRH